MTAFEQMEIEGGGQETSKLIEMVDDDALVDFTGTPADSTIVSAYRTGMWSIFVQPVPETAHAIHMKIQSTPHPAMTPWYTEDNGDADDHDVVTHIFKQATLEGEFIELGPYYGAVFGIKVIYGYVGGTGASASLKVYIAGRAQ